MSSASQSPAVDLSPAKPASTRRGSSKNFGIENVPRNEKVFSVTETELDVIASGNVVSRRAAEVGWGFICFGGGTIMSLCIESSPSPLSIALAWYVIPGAFILGAISFGVWKATKEKCEKLIDRIKGTAQFYKV